MHTSSTCFSYEDLECEMAMQTSEQGWPIYPYVFRRTVLCGHPDVIIRVEQSEHGRVEHTIIAEEGADVDGRVLRFTSRRCQECWKDSEDGFGLGISFGEESQSEEDCLMEVPWPVWDVPDQCQDQEEDFQDHRRSRDDLSSASEDEIPATPAAEDLWSSSNKISAVSKRQTSVIHSDLCQERVEMVQYWCAGVPDVFPNGDGRFEEAPEPSFLEATSSTQPNTPIKAPPTPRFSFYISDDSSIASDTESAIVSAWLRPKVVRKASSQRLGSRSSSHSRTSSTSSARKSPLTQWRRLDNDVGPLLPTESNWLSAEDVQLRKDEEITKAANTGHIIEAMSPQIKSPVRYHLFPQNSGQTVRSHTSAHSTTQVHASTPTLAQSGRSSALTPRASVAVFESSSTVLHIEKATRTGISTRPKRLTVDANNCNLTRTVSPGEKPRMSEDWLRTINKRLPPLPLALRPFL